MVEVLQAFFDGQTADLHTMMPGKIVSYDPATQSATVAPAFLRVYKATPNDPVAYPNISGVPVHQLTAGGAWVKLPVTAGDNCILVFAERALDAWIANGGQVDPVEVRRFNVNDCVAICGFNPKGEALVPKGAATSLEIQNGGIYMELTAAGKMTVKNAAGNELVAVLNAISTDIKALLVDVQTGQCAAPGSPLVMPTFVADLATLTADLAKLATFT